MPEYAGSIVAGTVPRNSQGATPLALGGNGNWEQMDESIGVPAVTVDEQNGPYGGPYSI
jgi:hypothetical protein